MASGAGNPAGVPGLTRNATEPPPVDGSRRSTKGPDGLVVAIVVNTPFDFVKMPWSAPYWPRNATIGLLKSVSTSGSPKPVKLPDGAGSLVVTIVVNAP